MGLFQDLKDKVMGTEAQNQAAKERMAKEDAKSPDTVQAKVNRSLEERKADAAKKAHEEYTNDRKNWPLNPKEDAINSAKAADAVKKAKGGVIRSSASKRADGCAIKGKTKGRMV